MKIKNIVIIVTLIIAWVNEALVARGYDALPWSESEIGEFVSLIASVATTGAGAWYNLSFTKAAKAGDNAKDAVRDGLLTAEEAEAAITRALINKNVADGDEAILAEYPEIELIEQTDNGVHDGDPELPGQGTEVDE